MRDYLQEEIGNIQKILAEITRLIEQHLEIVDIDIDEFDSDLKSNLFNEDGEKEFHESFRKIIMFHKNDIPFFEKHVPDLELLLSNALIQIKSNHIKIIYQNLILS